MKDNEINDLKQAIDYEKALTIQKVAEINDLNQAHKDGIAKKFTEINSLK